MNADDIVLVIGSITVFVNTVATVYGTIITKRTDQQIRYEEAMNDIRHEQTISRINDVKDES